MKTKDLSKLPEGAISEEQPLVVAKGIELITK